MPVRKKSELEKHGVSVPLVWVIGLFCSFAIWISLMHFNDRADMKKLINNESNATVIRIDGLVSNIYKKINKNKEAADEKINAINKSIADETMRSTVVDNTQDKILTKMENKLETTSSLAERTAAEAGIRHTQRNNNGKHGH